MLQAGNMGSGTELQQKWNLVHISGVQAVLTTTTATATTTTSSSSSSSSSSSRKIWLMVSSTNDWYGLHIDREFCYY